MKRSITMIRLLVGLAALVLAGCTSQQMLNQLAPNEGYAVDLNRTYDEATAQKLDIYVPASGEDLPIVVFFYGGRWSSGDKAEYKFVGQALASRGFVAVIANTRLYPAVRFPAFVQDGARAVRWAHDNAKRYRADPKKLFVMGHSSGAHIAAMLAVNEEYLKAVGGSRNWLAGMIGLAGPYDFLPITAPDLRDIFGPVDRFAYSQPIFFVDGKNAPMLLMHGEDDEVVAVKNTRNLARATAKLGGPVETVIYPKLSHQMIVGSIASFLRARADVLDQIQAFVEKRAKGRPVVPETQIEATPLPPGGGAIEAVPLAPPQPIPDYGSEAPLPTPAPLEFSPVTVQEPGGS